MIVLALFVRLVTLEFSGPRGGNPPRIFQTVPLVRLTALVLVPSVKMLPV